MAAFESKATYTFYRASAGSKFAVCGDGNAYQLAIQQTLNPTIVLLAETPPGEPGHDPALSALVADVNDYFAKRAEKLLLAKRRELAAGGDETAHRLEVTIFLTERGLQLGYDKALPRKEVAKVPRKPWWRRWFGFLFPKRYWVMPERAEKPAVTLAEKGNVGRTTKASVNVEAKSSASKPAKRTR